MTSLSGEQVMKFQVHASTALSSQVRTEWGSFKAALIPIKAWTEKKSKFIKFFSLNFTQVWNWRKQLPSGLKSLFVEASLGKAHNQSKARQNSNPFFPLISIKLETAGSSNDKMNKMNSFFDEEKVGC